MSSIEAGLELTKMVQDRLYDPAKYVEREFANGTLEHLTPWLARAVMDMFSIVAYKKTPDGEVIVTMVKRS